jgi:hypothetical protein
MVLEQQPHSACAPLGRGQTGLQRFPTVVPMGLGTRPGLQPPREAILGF